MPKDDLEVKVKRELQNQVSRVHEPAADMGELQTSRLVERAPSLLIPVSRYARFADTYLTSSSPTIRKPVALEQRDQDKTTTKHSCGVGG